MIDPEVIKLVIHAVSNDVFHALVLPVAVFSLIFYLFGVIGILQGKKSAKIKYVKKLPKVTIQIPTYNELVAIRCAESCLAMDYPRNKYEIIIGDDSSKKEVSDMIDSFARKHPGRLKVIRRGTNAGYKAGNLNNMLRYSKGEIIVIFDSDFIAPPNFLKKIVQPFGDEKVVCVQSKWSYLNMDQSPTSKFASTVLMIYHNILGRLNQRAGAALLFGSGEAIRKDVLIKLGGWQEGSVTEDVEFSVRVLVNGYKTFYINDLEAGGEVPYNMRSLRTQQHRWAYGNAKAYLQYRKQILFGKLSFAKRLLMTLTMLGYISSFFLVAFMFTGAVAFLTGNPSQINFMRLVTEVSINFILASGFTFAGVVALWKDHKARHSFVVFFAALTVGIMVSLSVCHGISKAVRGRPMQWNIIKKKGNMEFMPDTYGLNKLPKTGKSV